MTTTSYFDSSLSLDVGNIKKLGMTMNRKQTFRKNVLKNEKDFPINLDSTTPKASFPFENLDLKELEKELFCGD